MSKPALAALVVVAAVAFHVGGDLASSFAGPGGADAIRNQKRASDDAPAVDERPAAATRDASDARTRLARELDALAPQRPGHPDLFVLGIAGDGTGQVFLNEVTHLRAVAERRLDARGHVVVLANHDVAPPAPPPVPATPATIRDALAALGEAMDPDEDLLLLYVTTHGTDDHALLLRRDGWPDAMFGPRQLRRALDAAGIRHRVLVLSACFAGGFASSLQTPDTLFLAAARADRTSFGCDDDSVATFFGRAWLVDGLNSTIDFAEAFRRARAAIAMREAAGDYEPSLPQIREGERIGETLAGWRAAVSPGAPVPYPFAERGYAARSGLDDVHDAGSPRFKELSIDD